MIAPIQVISVNDAATGMVKTVPLTSVAAQIVAGKVKPVNTIVFNNKDGTMTAIKGTALNAAPISAVVNAPAPNVRTGTSAGLAGQSAPTPTATKTAAATAAAAAAAAAQKKKYIIIGSGLVALVVVLIIIFTRE